MGPVEDNQIGSSSLDQTTDCLYHLMISITRSCLPFDCLSITRSSLPPKSKQPNFWSHSLFRAPVNGSKSSSAGWMALWVRWSAITIWLTAVCAAESFCQNGWPAAILVQWADEMARWICGKYAGILWTSITFNILIHSYSFLLTFAQKYYEYYEYYEYY